MRLEPPLSPVTISQLLFSLEAQHNRLAKCLTISSHVFWFLVIWLIFGLSSTRKPDETKHAG